MIANTYATIAWILEHLMNNSFMMGISMNVNLEILFFCFYDFIQHNLFLS